MNISFKLALERVKETFFWFFGIALESKKEHGWKAYLFLTPFFLAVVVVVVMVVGVFR